MRNIIIKPENEQCLCVADQAAKAAAIYREEFIKDDSGALVKFSVATVKEPFSGDIYRLKISHSDNNIFVRIFTPRG